jgi:3' terminal RNA ribose 2'-O-methyltransferase Hen1
MLLSLTLTQPPATDLGYLLGKAPARAQTFPLAFGKAHVFYPEATPERCTATLLLDVDPVGLVRQRRGPGGEGGLLEQYVNDRPYVASSFLSVAIAQVYGTALAGRCAQRPDLAEARLPLEARLAVLPCRGGEGLLRRLFEPLGHAIEATRHPLDDHFPEWGPSPYFTVTLKSVCRLHDLLSHLYVLVPVLDNEKHYWVGDAEVDKLLRHGEGWLATHPEREQITRRYLKNQGKLARAALARLAENGDAEEEGPAGPEPEERARLNDVRLAAVVAALKECGARRVLDLGCGEGKLLRALLQEPQFQEVVGLDVSTRALDIANQRLERLPDDLKARARLMHEFEAWAKRVAEEFGYAVRFAEVGEADEAVGPPTQMGVFERCQ